MFRFPITRPRLRTGFSLVEVVLALGVVAISVLALIGILASTFASAREVALQHKAINTITILDGALNTGGGSILDMPAATPGEPPFNRVYRALANRGALDGNAFVDFYVYQKTIDEDDGRRAPSAPVIFLPASGEFTRAESLSDQRHSGLDGTSVFRVRARLSGALNGKPYKLNRATNEQDTGALWAPGVALDSDPDNYGNTYLPLTLQVFAHDFSQNSAPASNAEASGVKPVLESPLVILR